VQHVLPNSIIVDSIKTHMDNLGWRTLADRGKDARFNLIGKAVCGKVAISVDKLN